MLLKGHDLRGALRPCNAHFMANSFFKLAVPERSHTELALPLRSLWSSVFDSPSVITLSYLKPIPGAQTGIICHISSFCRSASDEETRGSERKRRVAEGPKADSPLLHSPYTNAVSFLDFILVICCCSILIIPNAHLLQDGTFSTWSGQGVRIWIRVRSLRSW